MIEQPLTFKTKSQLTSANPSTVDEPSTCVDAEPYALQVLDESMSPEFWQGCVILIDPTGRATHGSYVLAKADETNRSDDAYVFRQLKKSVTGDWTLSAINDQYPSFQTDAQLNDIVGVIVQRAGTRRHQHKRYD